jgi:hypothetical protein
MSDFEGFRIFFNILSTLCQGEIADMSHGKICPVKLGKDIGHSSCFCGGVT